MNFLRLVAITNDHDATLVERVVAAVAGGATCVQVRLKGEPARVVAEVTREIVARVTVPVLVNDRFDVALAAGAAGVHVGADDIPVAAVRRVTPRGFIIGTSVGCDAEVANAAEADYVGIGPIYGTGSKADAGDAIGLGEFSRLSAATGKPAVGIGGIDVETAAHVMAAGAAGIAVIGAIFGAPTSGAPTSGAPTSGSISASDPHAAARALYRAIETTRPAQGT